MTDNIATISYHVDPAEVRSLYPVWDDHEKYLGHRVEFTLCGHVLHGEVVGTERCYLANGIHDILEIELEGDRKQVKIQMHRQAVRVVEDKK